MQPSPDFGHFIHPSDNAKRDFPSLIPLAVVLCVRIAFPSGAGEGGFYPLQLTSHFPGLLEQQFRPPSTMNVTRYVMMKSAFWSIIRGYFRSWPILRGLPPADEENGSSQIARRWLSIGITSSSLRDTSRIT
jgi:hypothetical protein